MKKISLISLLIFLVDRITKILVTNNLTLNARNKIIDKFFYITRCHNEGAAFSIFSGNVIFLILITLVVLYLIYKSLKSKKDLSKIAYISYGLLLGGIVGNLFDRLFYGYVIDFLDFQIFKFDFAVFNIADMAIVIGALLLLIFEGSEKNGNKISSD